MRKIVVNNKNYEWRVGKSYCLIKGDNNFKLIVDLSIISGYTNSDMERAIHKRYFHVTPGQVKKYIEANCV